MTFERSSEKRTRTATCFGAIEPYIELNIHELGCYSTTNSLDLSNAIQLNAVRALRNSPSKKSIPKSGG